MYPHSARLILAQTHGEYKAKSNEAFLAMIVQSSVTERPGILRKSRRFSGATE